MTVQELECMLLDDIFVVTGHTFRKKKDIVFQTPLEARDFLIKFLLLVTTAGVPYTDEELLHSYAEIQQLVKAKSEISSKELPYHAQKRKPSKEIHYILDGCHCMMQ